MVPACRLLLELAAADGGQRWVVSDGSWLTSTTEHAGWNRGELAEADWSYALSHGAVGLKRWGDSFGATRTVDAYNSWMLARGEDRATDPTSITAPPGFKVESPEDYQLALCSCFVHGLRLTARCVLYYNTSWQGRRCALPLHPSRLWRNSGIKPSCTSETYRRFITRKRRLRSPPAPPSTKGTSLPCGTFDQRGEVVSPL